MLKSIASKWNRLGVQEKLHILIQGSLIVIFFLSMEWVTARFEEQILTAAEMRAEETADGLINGMNMMMLNGIISQPENRQLFLKKMQQSQGVNELRIIRGQGVIDQFGPGLPEERALDEMDRQVLSSGKVMFKRVDVVDGAPLLRVVVPFIALENYKGTNCLGCHQNKAGSVNGAASVTIDLTKDEETLHAIKQWLWLGHIAIQIFLSIIISWFVRVLIVKNIAEPVRNLQVAMAEIYRENDLSKRADVDELNPDIGEMARTFNALVDKLESATQRLELFGKMFQGSGEAILITNADRQIMAVNPAFTEITGYSADEVIGKNPKLLSSGKQNKDFYRTMWACLDEVGQWQGEIWNRRKSGEIYPEWLSIGVVKNIRSEVINYISLFSDITERKAAQQKIEFLAHYDSLTKLPNRALFADRLKLALLHASRNQSKVALLFLDLDKFKMINDTMGHLAGDLLLQSVANRLKGCVRESDTICRQGGDEFMILLPDVESVAAVENVAQKVILAMVEPHQIEGQNLVITFSVGISVFPDNAQDSEAMIKCADDAMYRAKERGRNNFQFY
ncbi:MAG: diguanylate cyclase [Gallionellaceae bacterium]|jgi:diguanylate cyclase (GGDEF)-like protein/PAS domain S-box-containing protein